MPSLECSRCKFPRSLGANSQDPENSDTRFSAFTDLTAWHTVQQSIQPATAKSPGRSVGSTIETSGPEADGCKTTKTPTRTSQASRGAPSSRHHRPLQQTPPRRQAKDCIPKPRSEHSSLPHHDPDACNGSATAALPKLSRSSPGSI